MSRLKPVKEIFHDIFKISLPVPGKKPGPVNVYLLRGEKNILIDTGFRYTVPRLEKSLEETGIGLSDIDMIIATHGHIDHYGGVKKIRRRAGKRIEFAAHREDLPAIETGKEVKDRTVLRFLRAAGVPLYYIAMMSAMGVFFAALSSKCSVDRYLKEGDVISNGNFSLKVIETPGHSRGSVCLFLEKENILFSGDHVLGHITPNAFAMLDNETDLPERQSQEEFFASLEKIKKLSPRYVLPGHDDIVENLDEVIFMYKESYRERDEKILSFVSAKGDTVYQIARKLFPHVEGKRLPLEIYLAVSEVYTHLQVLEAKGKVSVEGKKGLLRIALPGR